MTNTMTDFYHLYFLQTNLICIIINALIIFDSFLKTRRDEIDEGYIRLAGWINIVYCISDILASHFRGHGGVGVRYVLYVVNIIYVSTPLFYAVIFAAYSHYKLQYKDFIKTVKGKIFLAPLALCFILMITTPLTNFGFTIDENNIYQRSFGAYIIPIVCWIYFITTTVTVIIRIIKTGNYVERENLKPLAYFMIFPLITNILQISFYGITISQTGFTLATMLILVSRLRNQILNDELTKLRNRRDFNIYVNNIIRSSSENEIYVCMIDINKFKKINDRFGHLEGDFVLKKIGSVIKETCMEIDRDIFVCRYGGDEFVVANRNNSLQEIEKVKKSIKENLKKESLKENKDYDLVVSIGSSFCNLKNYDDYANLMEDADKNMYLDKNQSEKNGI